MCELIQQEIFGGSPLAAYSSIKGVLTSIHLVIDGYLDKATSINDLQGKLPAFQLRELNKIQRGIAKIQSTSGDLEQKISLINQAHATAHALPAEMDMLEEAKVNFETSKVKVDEILKEIRAMRDDIDYTRQRLADIQSEANQVMDKVTTAYGAATTVGLGAAFANRAKELSDTLWFLLAGLAVVLGGGAFITYQRVEFVHKLMLMPNVSYGILWINVTFTALSVSAPIWLAWLLTRQIGQRFRLAEDYGYKAAVAKAYEGYRAEAVQIDHTLSQRLFAIALDRLSEAPLKQVERESPGSPLHDVASKRFSMAFQPSKKKSEAPEGGE